MARGLAFWRAVPGLLKAPHDDMLPSHVHRKELHVQKRVKGRQVKRGFLPGKAVPHGED